MRIGVLMLLTVFVLVSCNSQQGPTRRLSEEEIAAYNNNLAFEDQILCVDNIRIGSYVRKQTCAVRNEWAELDNDDRDGRMERLNPY